MKKCLLALSLLLLLLPLFVLPAAGAEGTEDRLFSEFFSALPPDIANVLGDYTDPGGATALMGVEQLAALLLSAVQDGLSVSASFFARMLVLALLFALLARLTDDLAAAGTARIAELGLTVFLGFFVYRMAAADITSLTASLTDVKSLSTGLAPVFVGLYAAGGSTATATAAASGFTAFSYLLEHVCITLLLPALHLLFGLTALGNAGLGAGTDGIFSTLRGLYITVLSLLSLLLVTSLGFQTALAASADSVAAASVRFTLGQLIPVVGGSISSTWRTLTASLALLKSTVGTLSVVALLLMLLPTLITLLLHRLALSLAAGVSNLLGAPKSAKIFTSFRGIYDIAAATLALAVVLFLFIMSVLVRCGFAAGGVS